MGTRKLCLQGQVFVHSPCTEGVTRFKRREGVNEDENSIGVRKGVGNGDGEENESGDKRTDAIIRELRQERGRKRMRSGDGDETGTGTGTGAKTGKRTLEGRRGGGELWYPPHQKNSRVENQTLLFRT